MLAQLRRKMSKTLKNEKGQGMVEYILLLVVVVGLVLAFRGRITSIVNGKIDSLGQDINSVNSQ